MILVIFNVFLFHYYDFFFFFFEKFLVNFCIFAEDPKSKSLSLPKAAEKDRTRSPEQSPRVVRIEKILVPFFSLLFLKQSEILRILSEEMRKVFVPSFSPPLTLFSQGGWLPVHRENKVALKPSSSSPRRTSLADTRAHPTISPRTMTTTVEGKYSISPSTSPRTSPQLEHKEEPKEEVDFKEETEEPVVDVPFTGDPLQRGRKKRVVLKKTASSAGVDD